MRGGRVAAVAVGQKKIKRSFFFSLSQTPITQTPMTPSSKTHLRGLDLHGCVPLGEEKEKRWGIFWFFYR